MKNEFWHVWIRMPDESVTLDDIIEAGIKALGIDARLDETSYQETYEY